MLRFEFFIKRVNKASLIVDIVGETLRDEMASKLDNLGVNYKIVKCRPLVQNKAEIDGLAKKIANLI